MFHQSSFIIFVFFFLFLLLRLLQLSLRQVPLPFLCFPSSSGLLLPFIRSLFYSPLSSLLFSSWCQCFRAADTSCEDLHLDIITSVSLSPHHLLQLFSFKAFFRQEMLTRLCQSKTAGRTQHAKPTHRHTNKHISTSLASLIQFHPPSRKAKMFYGNNLLPLRCCYITSDLSGLPLTVCGRCVMDDVKERRRATEWDGGG